MYRKSDIILAVDYHDGNFVVRQLDTATGEECLLKHPTTAENISRIVHDAGVLAEASGGRVIGVMESTTGWARVKDLLGSSAESERRTLRGSPNPSPGTQPHAHAKSDFLSVIAA